VDRYVVFLRGMNLGGRRIRNEELQRKFEALGFAEVACFRASGNVVFAAGEGDEAALAAQIEKELGEALGYEAPVFLRSAVELRGIAAHEPFAARAIEASAGKLQVSLLAEKPRSAVRNEVLSMSTDADRLAIEGRELYWLPSGGMLDSALDLGAIESLLGRSTRRTKGTIDLIVGKYFAN
jgi:uncharacterized protein (DUF1697 family)